MIDQVADPRHGAMGDWQRVGGKEEGPQSFLSCLAGKRASANRRSLSHQRKGQARELEARALEHSGPPWLVQG